MRFWYHYNKPASKAAGRPRITVHYRGACHLVDNVVCKVPTAGRIRSTQPHFVIVGDGVMRVKKGVAVFTAA